MEFHCFTHLTSEGLKDGKNCTKFGLCGTEKMAE